MRILLQLSRFLTGSLFIFSGLIKLNDPYGFSYKLTEYFEVFAADFGPVFHSLTPIALELAFTICVIEIILGVAVLLFYRMVPVTWLLLLMILFFTFLTFYSAYFDKVKECGCFGDFIRLTPWQSFWKDIFLLVMILLLFTRRNKLKGGYNNLKGDLIVLISGFAVTYAGYYSIAHLPFIDWLPYAKGKSIPLQMKPEEEPMFVYILEKDGQKIEMNNYPADPSYKYVSYKVLNPEKSQPKIMDYRIWNEEGDYTDSSLTGKALLIILKDAREALEDKKSIKTAELLSDQLDKIERAGIKPMIISSSPTEHIDDFRHETQLATPYYFMDDTQLKTMIRANFGFLLLDDGVVKGKWHHNDLPGIEQLISSLN